MRYFIAKNEDTPIAVIGHDYKRGSYVCRAVLESFSLIFDDCVEKTRVKYVREGNTLRVVVYSPQEYEWIDDVVKALKACNEGWVIDEVGESSGSDMTIEDMVSEYLS